MSGGKDNRSRRIPIHVPGEAAQPAPDPLPARDGSTGYAYTDVDARENMEQTADDSSGFEVLDVDSSATLSEVMRELEAQDQADAEARANARLLELEPGSVSRGERAAAALAHQALSELAGLRAENVGLRQRFTKAEGEKVESLERLQRLQADFDNQRKRTERERGDSHSRLILEMAGKLLPVIDNLNRALKAEESFKASESGEFRHFLGGVSLIFKQLNDILESFGIEAIPAVGERFDPHFHEAVATEPSDEMDPDVITQELARGYRMGDKLLRPSMVKVSSRT